MSSTDRVSVTTVVAAPPHDAFVLFTDEIDRWWRRTPRHRTDPTDSIIRFQDDQLVEVTESGAAQLGRVLTWEPGRCLVFGWLGAQWPGAKDTVVEVTFAAEGDGTRITLVHRGWTEFTMGDARSSAIGLWWGDLLVGLSTSRG